MGPNNASGIVWAIFIVVTFPALQNINKHLYMLVSETNMKEIKREDLLWAKMMPDASFGPFSFLLPSLPFKTLTTSTFIS